MSTAAAMERVCDGGAGADGHSGPEAPTQLVHEAKRHADVARRLTSGGDGALARGAWRVATTLVLRSATKPFPSGSEHELVTAGSEEFVALLDRWRAPHVASLLEAASWAKADLRLGRGLRPHLPAFDVRRTSSGEARRDRDATALSAEHVAPADLARYEAAAAADVSSSLEEMSSALRQVVASMQGGTPIEGGWLAFEDAVLGLCVEPTSSLADRLDRRRVLLIGWRTTRRIRPVTAAVLRKKILLDRARWPGPVAGGYERA